MSSSLSFFSIISELISEANDGLHQAIEASKDQHVTFVVPQVEVQLHCTVVGNEAVGIILSNASQQNYYGNKGDSQLKLMFKLKP
jgi:hypothetical protein